MLLVMERTCKFCGKIFKHGVSGNMIIFCPNCRKSAGSISDYGFGPIVPCDIYLGEKVIGNISEGYILQSKLFNLNMRLNGEYKNLAVYQEAEEIIQTYL